MCESISFALKHTMVGAASGESSFFTFDSNRFKRVIIKTKTSKNFLRRGFLSLIKIKVHKEITKMTEINKNNFEKEVLQSDMPVVADFWAPRCGYCRRLAPVVERLDKEYADKIKFVKIDTDDNAALANEYGVDTIPTLILFKNGEVLGTAVNPGSQSAIVDWLKEKQAL